MNIEKLKQIYETESSITSAAKKYAELEGIPFDDSFRRKCSKHLNNLGIVNNDFGNETVTDSNNYTNDRQKPQKGFTAINEAGQLMPIEEYCTFYGLDINKIRSYKLISHTGQPFYNVMFYEEVIEPMVTEQELKDLIFEGFESIKYTPITKSVKNKIGVVKIADLHLGSYVDNLIRTKNFSIDILANKLSEAVVDINERNYSTVHVHILGDLIESFTGLSHKNTWKGLDKAMVGAEAVKLVVKILHDNFLSKIVNLGEVKVVAGNHDRTTSDNKEDVQGGGANLVCWGLELLGYNVEFNSLVITHTIGKITHILTHGHHALSKKSTKQLCWDYGVQGNYNLICEGHLHSIIQKLNVNQRDTFQTIKDDAVDHRRMNIPSFFTGNFFSESLGYTSESGFVVVEDNGRGVPNVFFYAV
jgi:predicted phosphodiesterase